MAMQKDLQQQTLGDRIIDLQIRNQEKVEKARIEAEKIAVAQRNAEKEAWMKIQKELPETAQVLKEFGHTFGKLAKVEVTNLETGEIIKLR